MFMIYIQVDGHGEDAMQGREEEVTEGLRCVGRRVVNKTRAVAKKPGTTAAKLVFSVALRIYTGLELDFCY
jgi:hypothetical protein